jgi:hypothetical protein
MPKLRNLINPMNCKGSQLMIECKVIAIVAKLVFSSFAKVITQCNKLNFYNKDLNCVAMD